MAKKTYWIRVAKDSLAYDAGHYSYLALAGDDFDLVPWDSFDARWTGSRREADALIESARASKPNRATCHFVVMPSR